MANGDEPRDPEVMDGDDLRTQLAAGASIIRIENENMQKLAVARPREDEAVLQKALKELDLAPTLAARNWYSIPYKNHVQGCRDRRNCDCPADLVEGTSVKAARNLMRLWGNAVAKAVIVEDDDDKITIMGVFTDLETNTRFEAPFVVYKWARGRGGKPYKIAQDRLVQPIQAGASKAQRNAILQGLPPWLQESYVHKARTIAAKDARENQAGLIEGFLLLGVLKETLERYLRHPLDEVTDDELTHLRGLYNALRDGDVTVEAVFATDEPAEPAGKTPAQDTVERVRAAGARVTGGTQAATPQPADSPVEGEEGNPSQSAAPPPASAPSPEGPASPTGTEGEAAGAPGTPPKPPPPPPPPAPKPSDIGELF